jgi:hypothetical protein
MQVDLATAILYSQVIVQKAIRANIPLSALVLKMMRTEVLLPLLHTARALPMAASYTAAWRAHLHAIATLHHEYGYDTVMDFSVEAAKVLATDVGLESTAVGQTPLAHVVHVISGVHDWWRQPEARAILSSTSEAELWGHVMRRTDATIEVASESAVRLQHLLSSSKLAPPAPISLEQHDVAAFGLTFRMALGRTGCLASSMHGGRGILAALFSVAPGCGRLRHFLRTEAGRASYLRPYGTAGGALGAIMRVLARLTLLIRVCWDAMLLSIHASLLAAISNTVGTSRSSTLSEGAINAQTRTLFEWMISNEPWTVAAAAVAAGLAVLRVIVRLLSVFPPPSVAPTQVSPVVPVVVPPQPSAYAAGPAATITGTKGTVAVTAGNTGASAQAPEQGAARSVSSRKTSRRAGKTRRKGPHTKQSSCRAGVLQLMQQGAGPRLLPANLTSVPAASTKFENREGPSLQRPHASVQPHHMRAKVPLFDSVAMRLHSAASLSQLSSTHALSRPVSERPSPSSLQHPATCTTGLAQWNPPLAADIAASLPVLIFWNHSGAGAGCMSTQKEALERLQSLQRRQKQDMLLKGKSSPASSHGEPFLERRADGSSHAQQPPSPLPAALDLESDDSGSAAVPDDDCVAAAPLCLAACGLAWDGHGAMQDEGQWPRVLGNGISRAGVPANFLCPLSGDIMESPVLACDEHVYERSHIEVWLQHHDTSPVTKKRLHDKALLPVLTLRSAIQAFKQRFPRVS